MVAFDVSSIDPGLLGPHAFSSISESVFDDVGMVWR
jgi:hypothetical protein